ncbi:MAG: hypothetical protein OES24_22850 [Acidimicrobiia bacterium]|nr:hypothetical protein [Acidimicrobiia bacterium]
MAGGSDHGDWSALDRDLVDSWVDDRHPAPQGRTEPVPRWPHVDDDDPTSDPFEGVTVPIVEQQPAPIRFDPVDEAIVDESFDGGAPAHDDLIGVVGGDPAATQFMNRTLEGTEVFPDDGRPPARTFDRRIDRSASHGSRERWPEERSLLPVPEIRGARLQRTSYAVDAAGRPAIDIRSSVLDRGPESHLVTMLREWRLPILAVVSVLALVVLVIVGLIAGGRDQAGTVATGAADDSGQTALGGGEAQDSLGPTVPGDEDGGGDVGGIAGQTTATTATTSTTVEQSALRVTTSSVQICHSNYGGCVPVAADVDCEGDGDGPAFQADPVAVFGDDVYELDTDGDRQACEADQPASAVAGSDSGGG